MPAKKKRATFSPTVKPEPQTTPTENKESKEAQDASPAAAYDIPTIDESRPMPHLEEMLAQDAAESQLKKKNGRIFIVGILFFCCMAAASGAVYYAYTVNSSAPPRAEADKPALTTPTPAPTATPIPLSLEVLNGSGVPGAALRASEALKEKGYVIRKTGNANATAKSSVLISASVPDNQVAELLSDLASLLDIGSSSGVLRDSTASARVTLGAK